MKKHFGLMVGLTVLGSAAFASGPPNSIESTIDSLAKGHLVPPHDGGFPGSPDRINLNGVGSSTGYGTLMVPVPEPSGIATLAVALGGLLLRRKKSSRP